MKSLLKHIILITFIYCILTHNKLGQPTISCSTGIAPLDLLTDSLLLSTDSTADVKLVDGQDVNCFNYTLPSPFLKEPNIAIAINGFQAEKSSDMFFSIKPVWSYQWVQVPFQIRTQWKYSKWIKISVNFLLESRQDIEAGYYQRDTGLVGSCGTFKSQGLFLPFVKKWNPTTTNPLTVRVFLNGFEVSSQQGSPYEIRLTSFSYNNTGINAKIIVNSSTIVNSIYVSYIVFETNKFGLRNINGFIEKVTPQKSFSQPILSRGFQVFKYYLYGVSGFQFSASNNIALNLNIGSNFLANFDFKNQAFDYIGFQYILFSFNPCDRCINRTLSYNNQCLQKCPPQTLVVGESCFSCPVNSFNNNGRCICKEGYYNISGDCTTCPLGQIFSNGICQGCGRNALWVGNLCQCNVGYYNISGVCTQCPKNTFWNGNSCAGCGQNSYFFAGNCQCQPGFYNISGICNKCPTGTIFNGKNCVLPCKPGEVWTGSKCLSLCERIPNSYWNGIQCICKDGFYNITGKCQTCQNGQVWNGSNCCDPNQNQDLFFVSFAKGGKGKKAD